jgi:hypothetical protein
VVESLKYDGVPGIPAELIEIWDNNKELIFSSEIGCQYRGGKIQT